MSHLETRLRRHLFGQPDHFFFFFFFLFFFFLHFFFPASGQAVVTGVVPFPPRFLPSVFIAHRVQQSHCSSMFHRVLLTHALALSASQLVHKKKSQRIYTSIHSAGLELTKLTYTRLEVIPTYSSTLEQKVRKKRLRPKRTGATIYDTDRGAPLFFLRFPPFLGA